MKLNSKQYPDATDFNSLTFAEKQAVVCSLIRGAAEQWGDECMPAADDGDNRLFVMEQIADWIDSLNP